MHLVQNSEMLCLLFFDKHETGLRYKTKECYRNLTLVLITCTYRDILQGLDIFVCDFVFYTIIYKGDSMVFLRLLGVVRMLFEV